MKIKGSFSSLCTKYWTIALKNYLHLFQRQFMSLYLKKLLSCFLSLRNSNKVDYMQLVKCICRTCTNRSTNQDWFMFNFKLRPYQTLKHGFSFLKVLFFKRFHRSLKSEVVFEWPLFENAYINHLRQKIEHSCQLVDKV